MKLNRGARVYDRWWPWCVGRVEHVRKTQLRVRWVDGGVWVYDRAHMKFLVTL